MPARSIHLPDTAQAWGTPAFAAVLRQELERQPAAQLPLQEGLVRTSHVAGDRFSVRIIGEASADDCIRVKVGILYAGIIAGCSCADDPTPIDEISEYCELLLEIDWQSGATRVTLLD